MMLFTKEIERQLAKNGVATVSSEENDGSIDHVPVVKIFNPCGGQTWLITESDPGDPDHLFGLCDLGFGYPELGYVSRKELEEIRTPPFGLALERDLHFTADAGISVYSNAARAAERIVSTKSELEEALQEKVA